MAQTKSLPPRPSLEYLRKLAKDRLVELRAGKDGVKLADAQLAVAREYGFASWRRLKEHVDRVTVVPPERVQKFIEAIQSGAEKAVRKMLRDTPLLARTATAEGPTALHVAVEHYNEPIVEMLIRAGAERDALWGNHGHTPMSWAVTCGAFDAAKALIKHGVKPDLFCAAGIGDLKSVESSFRDGKLVHGASRTGSSRYNTDGSLLPCPPTTSREIIADALYMAARNAHPPVVEFLLKHDPDLSFRAYMGGTPLHWAYFGASQQAIDLLLKAGADPEARDDVYKSTPRAFGILVPAAWGMTRKVLEWIARDPANVGLRTGDGKSILDLARENKHEALLQLFAKAKKSSWKPIMDAAFAGDPARVKRLLDAGSDPNALGTTAHRYRPLHRAIEHKKTIPKHEGHEHVVKLLLARGADPKLRATFNRVTALQLAALDEPRFIPMLRSHFEPPDIFHAAILGDEERVRELLKDRSQATARDMNEWTPLHYCAASRLHHENPRSFVAIAKMLLDAGADPMAYWNWNNEWPLRPLFYACGFSNNPAVAEVLLKAGADACDNESVYHASDEGHDECLALIEKYTDPKKLAEECTKCLWTQLHWGRVRGAKWLLEHGADPKWKHPKHRRTAIQEAIKQRKNAKVIDMLKSYVS